MESISDPAMRRFLISEPRGSDHAPARRTGPPGPRGTETGNAKYSGHRFSHPASVCRSVGIAAALRLLLLGGFAMFALVQASLGIYGVISYSVNQRTQEIGIRMALGASAGRLSAANYSTDAEPRVSRMLIGVVASWALARALGGLLFGVTSNDPLLLRVCSWC
jgi:hypothetical protein